VDAPPGYSFMLSRQEASPFHYEGYSNQQPRDDLACLVNQGQIGRESAIEIEANHFGAGPGVRRARATADLPRRSENRPSSPPEPAIDAAIRVPRGGDQDAKGVVGPRPMRPRNWWSWASPNCSAFSMSMTVAFGTSTPTSTTRCGEQHLDLADAECRHDLLLFARLQTAVQQAHFHLGQ